MAQEVKVDVVQYETYADYVNSSKLGSKYLGFNGKMYVCIFYDTSGRAPTEEEVNEAAKKAGISLLFDSDEYD